MTWFVTVADENENIYAGFEPVSLSDCVCGVEDIYSIQ
jgi:hypothetical protein